MAYRLHWKVWKDWIGLSTKSATRHQMNSLNELPREFIELVGKKHCVSGPRYRREPMADINDYFIGARAFMQSVAHAERAKYQNMMNQQQNPQGLYPFPGGIGGIFGVWP